MLTLGVQVLILKKAWRTPLGGCLFLPIILIFHDKTLTGMSGFDRAPLSLRYKIATYSEKRRPGFLGAPMKLSKAKGTQFGAVGLWSYG